MIRHKHADLIIAWAEGADIQFKYKNGEWFDLIESSFEVECEFRIKPKEPDLWENMPKHGALFKYVTDEGLANGSIRVFYSRPIGAKNWVPLTNEEIEEFKR